MPDTLLVIFEYFSKSMVEHEFDAIQNHMNFNWISHFANENAFGSTYKKIAYRHREVDNGKSEKQLDPSKSFSHVDRARHVNMYLIEKHKFNREHKIIRSQRDCQDVPEREKR